MKSPEGKNGTFVGKQISINGFTGGIDAVAKQLKLDSGELADMIREGALAGMSPGHPEMPGANVVSISQNIDPWGFGDNELQTYDVYIAPDDKTTQAFSYVAEMNKALSSGDRFTKAKRTNKGMFSSIATDLNPRTSQLDQYRIIGPKALSKDEYQKLKWVPNYEGSQTLVAQDADGNQFIKLTRGAVTQDITNKYTSKWDNTATGKSSVSYLKQ